VLLRWLADPFSGGYLLFAPLFAAVAVAVWYGGYRPALVSVVLGILAYSYLFMEPRGSFAIHRVQDYVAVGTYLLTSSIIIGFGQAMRVGQRRAAEGRERLRTTLASIGDAVIASDIDGRVTIMNPVAEALTGWTIGEARGRPLSEVFRIVNEQTRKPVENPVERALAEGRIVGLANHTVLIAKDGTERPIDDSAAPIRCKAGEIVGCVLIFRDISDRRQTETKLKESEERYRSLVSVITDVPWTTDSDGAFVAPQEAYSRYTGKSWEELRGFGWTTCIHPDDRDDVLRVWKNAVAKRTTYDALCRQWHGPTQEWRYVTARGTPLINADGSVREWAGTLTDVHEQKLAEEALRVSEQRARAFLNSSAIIAWLKDEEGRYVFLSETYLRRFGLENENWKNKTDFELWPHDIAEVYRREDLDALGRDRPFECVAPARTPNGEVSYWLNSKFWFQDEAERKYVGGVGVDITERKKAEDDVRRAEQLLRSVVENVIDGIITIDEFGTVESFNAAAEQVFGYKSPEVIGQNVKMLMPEPYHREHDNYIGNYLRTGEAKIIGIGREVVGHRKDGSTFPMELAVGEFHAGIHRHFTGIVRDITARKQSENERKERDRERDERAAELAVALANRTQEMRRAEAAEQLLRDADRHKNEFLATLAHELRNPLAPIRNAVEILLAKGPPDPDLKWGREVIDRQVRHMARLLDDLLDLSRISRGKLELRREYVELASVVHHASETVQSLVDSSNHELSISLPQEPIYLHADPVRLTQIFSNLLNNSCKYTEPGGRIWLAAERQGSDVVVSVKDNGIGISRDELAGVFDMFTQVDCSLERTQSGLGIGLSLVKQLTEMHGGTVEVLSDGPGLGSEFVVRLPILIETPMKPRVERPTLETVAARRILVVDDNKDSANTLAMLLKISGHQTHTAYDGLDAVAVAEQTRPDLVLLDIGLPKLNGFDACRRIRQQPWGRDMLLVAVTGWGQDEDRRKAKEAGFDDHLVKPVEHAALVRLLTDLTPVDRHSRAEADNLHS
jgi:PAS domain S-box-containing protein